jgi:3'-phosphoadenosine 5'-phosphosulfate sulfotransferase (PAPS reductase)/FAD synthetase
MARIVSWFSCGAASAVATKLAIQRAEGREVVVAYCDTSKREHPDNTRFLRDCEKWFGQEVLILGNDEYDRDPDVVFRKTRFLVGPSGARCTAELKRKVRHGFQRPDDVVVIGYTAEEYERRHARTAKAEPFVNFWPILHERGITKDDCLAMLERAGIELPAMYKLGYRNNNCIGCVKGQAGYWNKIRIDFPERFAEMAAIERELGRAICKREWRDPDGTRHLERIPLDRLPPDLGRYASEPDISCGIVCQSASAEIEDCDTPDESEAA